MLMVELWTDCQCPLSSFRKKVGKIVHAHATPLRPVPSPFSSVLCICVRACLLGINNLDQRLSGRFRAHDAAAAALHVFARDGQVLVRLRRGAQRPPTAVFARVVCVLDARHILHAAPLEAAATTAFGQLAQSLLLRCQLQRL